MKRLLALVAVALGAGAGVASGDTFVVVPNVPLPSAQVQNAAGTAFPEGLSIAPAEPQQLSFSELERLWQGAAATYGVPWEVLAAINKIESDFGRNMGPSSAGAIGWMQFMPSTWLTWGTDADGDGIANPWNADDAIYSAARYLAAAGAADDLHGAVFAYNHADWYVKEVLDLAAVYGRGGGEAASTLDDLQQSLRGAEGAVADGNAELDAELARVRALARDQRATVAEAEEADLLSDRLDALRRAAQLGADRVQAEERVAELRRAVARARRALAQARKDAKPAAFTPGATAVLGAPSFNGGWVFPVGGGPALVSVSHDHHDYPAADIAAPAGTPVYALGEATVLRSWALPEGRCGIGVTMQTADGQTWTYCHLAYLDPSVSPGAKLSAGAHVGLVGQTGHATGPHLHLQLQPASAYPQAEAWFTAFAGTAFRWQDAAPADSAAALTASTDD